MEACLSPPAADAMRNKIQEYQKGESCEIVAKSSFAPTRPLFLQMVEKLRVIAGHRLRTSGWFDEEEEDEEDEFSTFYEFSDDENDEEGDEDEENEYEQDEDEGKEKVETEGEDEADSDEEADNDDEEEDESQFPAIYDELYEEMDGEERRTSRLRMDEDTESETESEYAEEQYEEIFWNPRKNEGMEYEATCAIIGTAKQAEEFASLILQTNDRGLLKGYVEGKKMSGNSTWTHLRKKFTSWVRELHAGCEKRLDYNPLMTTFFEMIVEWNMRMISGGEHKSGGYIFEAALFIGWMQEEAAKENQVRAIAKHGRDTVGSSAGR